jgi:sulfate transport system substrate-binding protein
MRQFLQRSVNWRFLISRGFNWGFFTMLLLYIVWPWLSSNVSPSTRTIVVYGFSTLDEVMNQAIFPAFAGHWQQQTGETVVFISSFAGSGTVTNQLILGVPAEIAILSLELDAMRLADSGVLPGPTWRDLPNEGVLNRTPFIIMVRPGNPENIGDFADLARPGVGVVHPDPLTSGGAQWAILAEYEAGRRQSDDDTAAYQQLLSIWRNVVAQAASARAARTQFDNGFGDALITYEQEPLRDSMLGRLKGEIVYPPSTILSEHIVVVIDKNIIQEQQPLVEAFVDFLWSEEAQQIFIDYGFRSVDEALNEANPDFQTIRDPFTVGDMGGWLVAKEAVIDSVWRQQVLPELGK